MPTVPLQAAHIAWDADGTPRSLDLGDLYHPRIGAAAQARHVFLQGNGLPGRWRGQRDFTVLETGFGLGHNFVTTWQAWREDPDRGDRLHYVAIESRPPTRQQLLQAQGPQPSAEAQALIEHWPPLVGGLHRLDFDGGAVRLLLALGDVQQVLPSLDLGADAFYLDGFAPAVNPEMWQPRVLQALGRRARPGATAATWCVARSLRDALDSAGFQWQRQPGIGGKREVLRAVHRPRPRQSGAATQPKVGHVLVVGAGLAGAACAAALASLGVEVDVFEQDGAAAQRSSGNAAGLYHGTVHADDGPYARLFRSAALHTAQVLRRFGPERVPQGTGGLLRLERRLPLEAMLRLLQQQGLPAELVQALSADQASALAGVPLPCPAWHHLQGGWAAPAALVRTWLEHPRIRLHCGRRVQRLQRGGAGWQLLADDASVLAESPQVVLAVAEQLQNLLLPLGGEPLPQLRSRGQVTLFPATQALLRLPVAGGGYALQLPDGTLLCGASSQPGDDDALPRLADHQANLDRLQRLTGLTAAQGAPGCLGRVGWRVQPADKLPLAGPLPALRIEPGARLDQARLVPREAGLHLLSGLGARGLTLAPLLGEVVAARITGTPVPLPQGLVDQVDPARALVRRARARRTDAHGQTLGQASQ